MALSSNLTTFSDVTDGAPLSPAYLSGKFGVLDKNILQVNTSPQASNVFHVEDPAYGAVGGDTGDQTAAIQAAADAAIAAGGMLTGTAGTTYRCTGVLDWSDLKYCDFTGVEIHSTITSGYALTIGSSTVVSGTANPRMVLPALRSDQTGANGVDGNPLPEGDGLLVKGLRDGNIGFQKISFFQVGVTVAGDDASRPVVYNDFYDIFTQDCTTAGLLIKPAASTTWCNENRMFGGHLVISSTYANETGSALMRIDDTGAGSNPNGWQFFGLTLEGVILKTMDIISAGFNTWWGCRWEGAADITFGTECDANIISGGEGIVELITGGIITDSSTLGNNGIAAPGIGHTVFQGLGNLADSATPTVLGQKHVQTHANATTVTDFADGVLGQEIFVVAPGAQTITHNTSLIRLAGSVNFVMAAQDVLHLLKYSTGAWREVSRANVGSTTGLLFWAEDSTGDFEPAAGNTHDIGSATLSIRTTHTEAIYSMGTYGATSGLGDGETGLVFATSGMSLLIRSGSSVYDIGSNTSAAV